MSAVKRFSQSLLLLLATGVLGISAGTFLRGEAHAEPVEAYCMNQGCNGGTCYPAGAANCNHADNSCTTSICWM